jgi:hypothetical protein
MRFEGCYGASLCSIRRTHSQSYMDQSGAGQNDTSGRYGRNQPPARSRDSSQPREAVATRRI